MISTENFKDLLRYLQFAENGNLFTKDFATQDCKLVVDFHKHLLIYPEDKGLIINERQTCNFSSAENFVVFECVHRLLKKGYKPEHIELEPKIPSGRDMSGGRADILVKDFEENPLLIIECKTAGREFNVAWEITRQKNYQLFVYAMGVGKAKFATLYASDFVNDEIIPKYYIINLQDNEQFLEDNKGKDLATFKEAYSSEQLFKVWKETYQQDYQTKGLFEKDIPAYQIGKKTMSVAELEILETNGIQPKYHEFATILRRYNVSGRENAFDKLVNLFLCKIVDEKNNPHNLKFYWKGIAYDSYFDLIDRLQKLYKEGMQEFLKEEVTYIDNEAIDHAFRFFKNDPDATKDTIKDFFKQLKFYSNNDFAFIDVHNERLFYQNAEVLLDIVRLFQDMQLNGEQPNQFLGDLFEGFLDQGVKQSEGQFFTPLPITKFILMSLPLESWIKDNEKIPAAIDYACGSGHFLTELATQIKPFIETYKAISPKEYYSKIYGVEKEYRLSKVAKVSAFMYNQDEINIVYADALAENDRIRNNSFDLLVANPPFSVKGFLTTLAEKDQKSYELFKEIDTKALITSRNIETFFIERAKQLLKPDGIAAIIVPVSILENKKSSFNKTREILLQNFDIVSIVVFGDGTFGRTGTNTVTLFLRRKEINPSLAAQYKNVVNFWFNGDYEKNIIFENQHFIRKYCEHIKVNVKDYKQMLEGKITDELYWSEIFEEYAKVFKNTEAKIIEKYAKQLANLEKIFLAEIRKENKSRPEENQLTDKELISYAKEFLPNRKITWEAEQKAEIDKEFLKFVKEIEKEKMYYFILASHNPQKVLIVKVPTDSKAQKQFLGYEWSAAKGKEGIKYLAKTAKKIQIDDNEDEIIEEEDERVLQNIFSRASIQTQLYNHFDRYDAEKVNTLIQRNFTKGVFFEEVDIPDKLKPHVTAVRLVDLLDFSRKDFDKKIATTLKRNLVLSEIWELVRLGELIQYLPKSKRKAGDGLEKGKFPFFTSSQTQSKWLGEADYKQESIILGTGGIASIHLANNFSTSADVFVIVSKNDKVLLRYIFYIFQTYIVLLEDGFQGIGLKHLSREYLENIKIPLPTLEIQEKIVLECEAIDKAVESAKSEVRKTKKEIENLILDNDFASEKLGKIAKKVNQNIEPQNENGEVIYIGLENIESNTGVLVGNIETQYSYIESTKTCFQKNDVLYGKLRPNLNKVYLAQENGICSTDILVFRFENEKLAKYYSHYLLTTIFNEQVLRTVSGQQLPRTSWTDLQEIKIPVPPLSTQETLVSEIEKLELQIAENQGLINGAKAKKEEVLKRYL
jgi:type I restriction-modification system DNA methylase subunit/restriction endonuclease S subunit